MLTAAATPNVWKRTKRRHAAIRSGNSATVQRTIIGIAADIYFTFIFSSRSFAALLCCIRCVALIAVDSFRAFCSVLISQFIRIAVHFARRASAHQSRAGSTESRTVNEKKKESEAEPRAGRPEAAQTADERRDSCVNRATVFFNYRTRP